CLAMRLYGEFHAKDDAASLAIEGLALELLAGTMRCDAASGPRTPRWLERVREMLHDRFSEHLTIAGLAMEVEVHPVYLGTLFRSPYGCSIGESLRKTRVSYAARRLATTADALADIGLAAGFADQSHFSRTFKDITGVTPLSYRSGLRRR